MVTVKELVGLRPVGDRGRLASTAIAAVGVTALVAAHLVNPSRDHWLPKCPFHELTGLWCPGCGSTRAACALARGDVFDAIRHNALFVPALLLLVWVWGSYAVRSFVPTTADRRWARNPLTTLRRPWSLAGLAVLVVVFFVLRNVPGAPVDLLSR